MNQFPFVSIIILNFNGKQWIEQCLRSLETIRYPKNRHEVIMGDNASTDDSVNFTEKNFPWVRIIQHQKNTGFCKGNNLCSYEAKGEYLVFLNNDTYVTPDWLSHLVQGLSIDPKVICCSPKILCPHLMDGKIIQAAGGVISPSGGGYYDGWMEEDCPEYNEQKFTGFGCGAGVLIQKKFFLETGGFDEYYFYSNEENDLGLRVWLYGYKVLYVPTAVMYHYMGRTGFRGKGVTPAIEFLIMRNNLHFIFKNFELINVFKGFFLYSARYIVKMGYALLHGNFKIAGALIRAKWFFLKDIGKTLRSRKITQSARKVRDKELIRNGILLNSKQMFERNFTIAQNMKKRGSDNFYDTQDSVKIRQNKDGELEFYKA